MKLSRTVVVSLALAALIAAVGAAVWADATRVKGEISLAVHYGMLMCDGGLGLPPTPPTWDQLTAIQRATAYDKDTTEKIFMSSVLWHRTGDYLTEKGLTLGEPTTWRDQHVSIRAGEVAKSATGDVVCRYEIIFSGVAPELAARVLFAAEHTYREHVFKFDSENTTAWIHTLEAQIAKLEAASAETNLTGPEFDKTSASLAASRRQLTEAREDLRLIALRRTLTTAQLL